MATFTAIKNKAQGNGTMKNVLNYVKRKDKTLWNDRQLVTGWSCVAQSAYDEMMTTKRQYGKTDGRMFYQFVQSFSPEEDVTPEEVHAIGLELAQKLFPEFEVVVATHVDADHLHSHLIVNSVSCTTGRKLHQNAADLQRQRQVSDAICAAHGLTVLEPPKKYVQEKKMRPGEYRSAVKGQSWKLQLMAVIDDCMARARSKRHFIEMMEAEGYQVKWAAERKNITYTTPSGMRCRDDRLHEEKYLKRRMEDEFRIRAALLTGGIESLKQAGQGGGFSSLAAGHSTHTGTTTDNIAAAGSLDSLPDIRANGTADSNGGIPAETGWEREREILFSAETALAEDSLQSVDPADPHTAGGILGDVLELGYAVEKSFPDVPIKDSTTLPQRIDSAEHRKTREKKLALGQKPDDQAVTHEQQM